MYFVLGLGKASQGISTALSVEKTSKRGGKIVNVAAEQGILLYTYCTSTPYTFMLPSNYETQ